MIAVKQDNDLEIHTHYSQTKRIVLMVVAGNVIGHSCWMVQNWSSTIATKLHLQRFDVALNDVENIGN